MGGGGGHCCVYGCKSRGRGLSYYKFPSRPWEQQRRKEWISAVRRCHPMGKKWEPTKHSVVCSLHFEGGKKMEDPRLNSYNPTIFPPSFKKKAAVSIHDDQEIRNDNTETLQIEENVKSEEYIVNGCPSIGIQTKPFSELMTQKDNVSTHYVWNDPVNHEASTQTYVALHQVSQNNKSKIIVVAKLPTVTRKTNDKLDEVNMPGFIGYSDKIEDLDMKQLSGVSLAIFHTLLKILVQTEQGQLQLCKTLNAENRLLLFLMKLKLGLAFSTIGLLFKVSATVASGIFESILEIMFENIMSWVKWPSRQLSKEEVPCRNYPKCCALIDFIELRTNSPTSASSYFIKFLIAINPSESIIFVSKGYGGGTTNEFIINDSGFIDLVEAGDEIMVSKELPGIKSELLKKQCVLISPTSSDSLLTALEVVEGSSIRDTQIDQTIQQLKKFKIIDQVDIELLNKIDKIMLVICAISK